VKLPLIGSVVAVAFLAACASGGSNYSPGTTSPSSDASLVRPAAKGPTYAISIVLPDGKTVAGMRDHASAAIGSLRADTYIKNKKYVFVVNNGTCTMSLSGTTTSGCGVFYNGAVSYPAVKATFEFFSKAGGKGCLLAAAKYKGGLTPSSTITNTLKAFNTKTCWH
jgi:hypothetical protein